MRSARLSVKLGITVTAMSAVLVLLMATFALASIWRQLDIQAKDGLKEKLSQVEHSLAEGSSSVADIVLHPHNLRDQIVGHDNLTLTILDSSIPRKRLLSLGEGEDAELPVPKINTSALEFKEVNSAEGFETLMAYKLIRLKSDQQILVMLTLDRKSDYTLLKAYVKSTLIALPLILLLVGGCAWWVVHRGLKPLRAFRRVAESISARDLSHRMKVQGLPEELSDLAHAVNFMLHRLDSDVQQLAQFSDDLAHELRSPMNNLMGTAQVTLSRERPPQEYKQVLESCTEELERLSRMVSQMLFLASVSQPSAPLTFSSVDLQEEANKVSELFAISAEEKKMSVEVSGEGTVLGDKLMIQRAISNLLSNAIRHGSPGSIVTLGLSTLADEVQLAVSNAGEGIEAEHLPRLFDRFYRVHPSRSRQQGGTGLGLAIVRSIMSLHEGRVTVKSELGRITTFSLIFPKAA
ncbi:heavy metal sensor histidine kinase [Pseudomonas abietaniphila]|jgi:two-component system heavy metal sensor histidine kinase CusS|uniref:heavy metal sensor histidine kinase n=1 Tax=Pseudomonas abietaniphila TaxID=89065 RepID=UPI00078568BB|nr:heavy metal sensor histidine kinase [Pseudomonas abietaniphila]